jgi:predicted helicase
MTIHEILAEFREDARNNRDLGDRFERLVVGFLKTDPQYASLFGDQVWLWMDWSGRRNRPDIGIDIVAEDQSTHEVWAIQCKFYLPEHTLQKGDIDSFFTASGKKPFAKRMIVSTTDKWGKHAEDALKNQTIPTIRMGIDELLNSPIEWSSFSYRTPEDLARRERHHLRPHQQEALQDAVAGFENGSRGKLIMACGTGKTFTSLRIAERVTGSGGLVLFLVPSISLLSQTLREWTSESETELRCYAICSDAKASKETTDDDISVVDLALPAHTDPRKLVEDYRASKNHQSALHIVFSTYQSIEVISRAQGYGLPRFDLIVCDEAHRTTGIEQSGKEASAFVRVHDDSYIKSKRRLYMTATPRIYDDSSKGKAKEKDVILYSMDDERHYGPEFHRLDFSKAVRLDLLTDYKVLVLAVDEGHVSRAFQAQLADANNELDLNDATRIAGCYNGLRKRFGDSDDSRSNSNDAQPMRRAVAFCRDIKSSKLISTMFGSLVNDYVNDGDLTCEAEHVDGTYNSLRRNRLLQWLRDDSDDGNTCRILSNARCLSEGVDVPALDAVMFMHPRKSVVDVVQSVGRVMRKAPGKDYGYIILPIGIPSGIKPEDALADNERYRIVWQVLQALRAHDDRFNATINKIELNKKRPGQIRIIGVGGDSDDDSDSGDRDDGQHTLEFPDIEEWRDAIYARMVLKCGTRVYWEQWANDVARIAERHIARITNLLQKSDSKYRREFDNFLQGLRENINPAVSEDEATEMLAQHLITKPVFDALFDHYEFSTSNPVSVTMQRVVDALDGETIEKESQSLQGFYASVRERAAGIDNAEGRQRVIVELYEKFFRQAFPRMSQRLGIVYTPVEIVDFILRSTEWALRKEFGIGLGDQGVHVLDPFVGTGTFPLGCCSPV